MYINIGNMSFSTTEEEIREVFAEFGTVTSVKLMINKEGQSRGFGFIVMDDDFEGKAAIKSLNGREFAGRKLRVNEIDASEMPS
ncbi:MAG: RNA-binding protein [Zetaproteobacteria bacterium CG2_30_46_52]|nr:MAG: RNA-binding protein [Zetaproteobacteria bacterium CG2_30_46_52]